MLANCIHPAEKYDKGFQPKSGVIDYEFDEPVDTTLPAVDSLKIKYLDKLVKEVQEDGSKLIFVISPHFKPDTLADKYNSIEQIAKKYNIPLWEYTNDPDFISHNELFYDSSHLNSKGADKFTKTVVDRIRRMGFYQILSPVSKN